jgi:hypothetical protein
MATRSQHESKTKLQNAVPSVIRTEGCVATTVDDICHAAGHDQGRPCGETELVFNQRREIERKEIP